MDVYAIANQKGGVGKTTVTLGLSAELARRASRVLVIDLDPQASATKVLGSRRRGAPDGRRCDAGAGPLPAARCDRSHRVGLRPGAGRDGARVARVAARDGRRVHPAPPARAVDGYDVVLIDCPPSLGLLTINALAAASRLIVVTEPSFLALQGIKELLDTYELVREHYNPRLELAGVIVNRWERTVEHRESCAEIERYFGDGLAGSRTFEADGAPGRGAARRSRASADRSAVPPRSTRPSQISPTDRSAHGAR